MYCSKAGFHWRQSRSRSHGHRTIELYDLVKIMFWFFWFRLRLHHARSSENWIVGVTSRSRRTKPITSVGSILWLVYPSASTSDSNNLVFTRSHTERKQRSRKQSPNKMETFWFFWLQFCRTYDFDYDSDFWFALGHEHSYNSAYDSDSDPVTSENQP